MSERLGVLYDATKPWWEYDLDDTNVSRAMFDTVRDIERRQMSIHDGNKRHARIYAGYLPSGLVDGTVPTSNMRMPFAATKNLVRSVCDVGHAMITRSRPKPTFVTDGADWKIQMQAEDLDQFMMGAYMSGHLYETAPRSFHDSTIFGTGGWKYVTRGTGEDFRVNYERVLIDDIVVDEEENRVDCFNPPNVYHRMLVRTDALIRKYASGDSREASSLRSRLMATGNTQWADWPGIHVTRDRSILIEAIHVDPDYPERNVRVLAVDGILLKAERWPYAFQPYTFLWWALPITGFYGDGIAYRQFGRQERITYMHRWIQTVLDRFATPTAWLDPVGGPPTLQMSNELGKIIMARRPPQFQTQQLITGEIWHWLNKLEHDGFEDEGMNQQMTAGEPPPGVESAPAQREAVWRQGQRFFPVSQRWEYSVAVDTAYKTAAMYKRASESGTKPRVKWADRKLLYTMEWPDLEDNAYLIRPDASSLDSLSPSARMQSALELAQTGWIDKDEGRSLVAHPDLRASDALDNSPTTYAKFVLHQLWRGVVVPVDEKAELVTLMRVVKQGRLLAITKGVEKSAPEVLRNLDNYLDSLDVVMKNAQDAAMAEAIQQQQAQQQALAPRPGSNPSAGPSGVSAPFTGQ
jgi:hypothetical protein